MRELLQQALDVLESMDRREPWQDGIDEIVQALKEQLAKPEQKPVAYWDTRDGFIRADDAQYIPNWSDYYPEPLYSLTTVSTDNSAKTVDHGFDRTASHMEGEYVDTEQANLNVSGQCVHKSDESMHEMQRLGQELDG